MPGHIAAWRFKEHSAEEVLYFREKNNSRQDPGHVPRWRREKKVLPEEESSMEASHGQSLASVASLVDISCESSREPYGGAYALKALPAPSPVSGSPFSQVLGFLHKEPDEIEAKRSAALRRNVQKMLRQIYRRSVEASGTLFRRVDPPWPPKDRGGSLPKIEVHPLLRPWVISKATSAKSTALKPQETGQTGQTSLERCSERKAAINTLTQWGRCSQGGPYTLRQVYEEVEADVQHRPPHDVRAVYGRLGPELLGPGTTRARRKLPFEHPQRVATESLEVSGASVKPCNGTYQFAILHNQKPLFRAANGAVIYWDGCWKMNSAFNTNAWLYSRASRELPEGTWTCEGLLGITTGQAPTVTLT